MGTIWPQKPPLGVPLNPEWAQRMGCVLYLPLNEGGGNRVNDLSGHGISLTKASTGVWSSCPVGPCLSRTGTTQPLASGSAGPRLAFSNTDDFTLVFYGLVGGGGTTAFSITANASILSLDTNFYYYSTGGSDRIYFYTTGSSSVYTRVDGVTPVYTSTPLHVVGVYQGATKTRILYMNGVQVATGASDPGTKNSTELVTLNNSNGWAGYALIFNRALTADEVARLYMQPFEGFQRSRIELWTGALTGEEEAAVYSGRGVGRGIGRGVLR
jgi:hypothetical protein